MTGATGGIGSKVARKLVKYGIKNINYNDIFLGARVVVLVQNLD